MGSGSVDAKSASKRTKSRYGGKRVQGGAPRSARGSVVQITAVADTVFPRAAFA